MCKSLHVIRKDSGCSFSKAILPFCWSIKPPSPHPPFLTWEPPGISGDRLVYCTFHHISYWIIHLALSRGQMEGEDELWDEGQRENEWIDRIYTAWSGKLIIEIWSASHILWLLERALAACLAKISGPLCIMLSRLAIEQCLYQDRGESLEHTSCVQLIPCCKKMQYIHKYTDGTNPIQHFDMHQNNA